MDILEKSKEYAKGKAIDAITSAIEQAYADGYKDGLQHYENERLESVVDGVNYVDLKLPSGTMWASDYIRDKNNAIVKFTYMEASKLCIPTKADFEELCNECQIDQNKYYHITFTGQNGKIIDLEVLNIENVTIYNDNKSLESCLKNLSVVFWLKDDSEDKNKNYARVLSSKEILDVKAFMGYKMPVLLVLRKNGTRFI